MQGGLHPCEGRGEVEETQEGSREDARGSGNTLCFLLVPNHVSPVSQVVAEELRPGGWRWVVAESGKVVVWVPMAHPSRSGALLWYRKPHSPRRGKEPERMTGAREGESMCR